MFQLLWQPAVHALAVVLEYGDMAGGMAESAIQGKRPTALLILGAARQCCGRCLKQQAACCQCFHVRRMERTQNAEPLPSCRRICRPAGLKLAVRLGSHFQVEGVADGAALSLSKFTVPLHASSSRQRAAVALGRDAKACAALQVGADGRREMLLHQLLSDGDHDTWALGPCFRPPCHAVHFVA